MCLDMYGVAVLTAAEITVWVRLSWPPAYFMKEGIGVNFNLGTTQNASYVCFGANFLEFRVMYKDIFVLQIVYAC